MQCLYWAIVVLPALLSHPNVTGIIGSHITGPVIITPALVIHIWEGGVYMRYFSVYAGPVFYLEL